MLDINETRTQITKERLEGHSKFAGVDPSSVFTKEKI